MGAGGAGGELDGAAVQRHVDGDAQAVLRGAGHGGGERAGRQGDGRVVARGAGARIATGSASAGRARSQAIRRLPGQAGEVGVEGFGRVAAGEDGVEVAVHGALGVAAVGGAVAGRGAVAAELARARVVGPGEVVDAVDEAEEHGAAEALELGGDGVGRGDLVAGAHQGQDGAARLADGVAAGGVGGEQDEAVDGGVVEPGAGGDDAAEGVAGEGGRGVVVDEVGEGTGRRRGVAEGLAGDLDVAGGEQGEVEGVWGRATAMPRLARWAASQR
ncbi:MAG: hypothetical protein R3F59_21335 [Myxococcota bacterium]